MLVVTGCGSKRVGIKPMPGFEDQTRPSVYWAYFDSNYRASVVYHDPEKKIVRVLSEVPPDTALSVIHELSSKINYKEIEAEQTYHLTESVSELGKRTVAVNVLRDALYRLAELSSSKQINQNEKELFLEILKAATTIAIAEQERSKAQLSEAVAEEAKSRKELLQAQTENLKAIEEAVKTLKAEGVTIADKELKELLRQGTLVPGN